jgi:hypothetical protein
MTRKLDCRSLLSREGIFICYRHDDVAAAVLFVAAELKRNFGRDNVFYDIGLQQKAGADFREEIEERIRSSYALLAVVGPSWLSATDGERRRRLHDPEDFVRMEIEMALQEDIRVIPVLVEGARMPGREDLPPSMEAFAYRQAQELSFRRPVEAIQALIHRLERPPPHRFVRWRELKRHAPSGALIANALWHPWWANVVIPPMIAAAGVVWGHGWLITAAPLVYLGLVATTLFDIWEARCVALRAPPVPSKGKAPALPLVQPTHQNADATAPEA